MESPEQFHSPSIEFIKSIKPEIRQFENNYSYICYIALYEFAAHYCCRKRVLDAACGLGFGSYFLAQIADQVVGLDIDKERIQFASTRYQKASLHFMLSDATSTCLRDHSFDVIVSIETFEHIPPDRAVSFLKEMKRLLAPGGILVISTPNRSIHRQISRNPDHINEIDVDDFFALISRIFGEYEPYYQRKGVLKTMQNFYCIVKKDRFKLRHIIPHSIRRKVNRFIAPELHRDIPDLLDQLKVHKASELQELKDAVFQIAVCQI